MLHNVRNGMRRPALRVGLAVLAAASWVGAVGAGWYALLQYDYATSDAAPDAHLVAWPEASRLPRTAGEATLITFLHPKCPCSPATLTELERALAAGDAAGQRTNLLIVPVTPPTADAGWTQSDVVRRAAALPGANVCFDHGGFEAALFGARDSGAVLYFDADGQRRFTGGVTLARGHEGPNRNGETLAQIMSRRLDAAPPSPVFGCRLYAAKTTPSGPPSSKLAEDAPCVEATFVDLTP